MNKYKLINVKKRKVFKELDMGSLGRGVEWKKESIKRHKDIAKNIKFIGNIDSCPICQSIERSEFTEVYGVLYHECNMCGHIYMGKEIRDENVEDQYKKVKNKKDIYMGDELFLKRVDLISKEKVEWISEEISEKGLWIDIGSATGEILYSAKEKGYKVLGIESNEDYVEFAENKGIKTINKYLTKDNAKELIGEAKIVSFFNVIEHIKNPLELLNIVSTELELGSYLVIEVPRHPSLSSLNSLCFSDWTTRYIYPPGHIHVFTELSMKILLEKIGLNILSIWTYGQDIQDLVLTSKTIGKIKNNDYFDYLKKKTNKIQKSIDEIGLSDNMIIIARKDSNGN